MREFKIEAVKLVTESPQPLAQVARDLSLRLNLLLRWKHEAGLALFLAPPNGRCATRVDGQICVHDKRKTWDTAVERGKEYKEYMERRTETLKEAGQKAREVLQTGKEAIKEVGKEIAKEAPNGRECDVKETCTEGSFMQTGEESLTE